jgi:hypothetical protein
MKKRVKRVRRVKTIDDFIEDQISRYVRIHKRHEKEINYIG